MKKEKIVIHVSFKETIADLKLYNWICQNSSKSGFIKDLVRKEMLKQEQNK